VIGEFGLPVSPSRAGANLARTWLAENTAEEISAPAKPRASKRSGFYFSKEVPNENRKSVCLPDQEAPIHRKIQKTEPSALAGGMKCGRQGTDDLPGRAESCKLHGHERDLEPADLREVFVNPVTEPSLVIEMRTEQTA